MKLAASVYDMYDHENYAERHNANSPVRKPFELSAEIDKDSGETVRMPEQGPADVPGMPAKWPVNKPSAYPDGVVPHRFPVKPNIEGTGHGKAYGRPNHNTPYNG